MPDPETVADHFAGYFTLDRYDGSHNYERKRGTPQYVMEEKARLDFYRLIPEHFSWTQVHGDLKTEWKKATFTPYPHWPELYESCKLAIAAHAGEWFSGNETCAKIMDTAMHILRASHGMNAPRWWLAIMNQLRGWQFTK
jgi:hypothetical protein